MNAYLKGMHRQKNIMSPHQSSIKIYHYTMNDNEHKGKCNLFSHLGFEITLECLFLNQKKNLKI